MSGYILEPTPDGRCSFTYISHIDPCGGIPKMVINYIGTKMVGTAQIFPQTSGIHRSNPTTT